MATSGSVDWTTTRDEIIKAAYRLVVVDEDFTPTTNQTTNASLLLNAVVKSYNAKLGMPLWAMGYGFILPFSGSYSTNTATGHVTSSYVTSTLIADAATNDTTVDISSITGISASDNIGIELDSGDMHWTTVSGSPSGDTVTLAAGITGAASTGNRIYAYTSKINRPLRIIQAYTVEADVNTSQSDVPCRIVTTEEYLQYSNKTTEQYPLFLSPEPSIGRMGLKIWPRFSNGDRVLVFRYHRPLEDFDAGTDTPDFPVEWNLPLIYELAILLAPTYNMEIAKLSTLRRERDKWVSEVSENDYEEGSIHFQPSPNPHRM